MAQRAHHGGGTRVQIYESVSSDLLLRGLRVLWQFHPLD
jgi:hypothetical protein